ncbi:MAG TPA: hypothetical protein VEU95_14235 [Micropepsaceae bacterium]|nr:hypothetical protein [Micropepsaceae bacterium]
MSGAIDRPDPKPPSVDRLALLWRRLYDQKLVQWSVAYIALAYGIQHGVVLTSDALDWPHVVSRISILLLALGVPLVMTLAWYHGDRASRQFSKAELSILSVLLVIGSLLFYVFVRPTVDIASPGAQQAGVTAARSAATSTIGAISLAVLPFVNLSSDKEQEFFSDGMTEEITAALAKVPDLRVVGRTSAFQFKGQNQDLRSIGQSLAATHLIEGSVRKEGNRVRITVQLIKSDDGTHIWSENYDRELTDVFAIQEDVARAIATSLRMPLGLKPGENLVNNRGIDPESYQQFLRSRAVLQSGGPSNAAEAQALLEQVIARNPDYAPALARLSFSYTQPTIIQPALGAAPPGEARRIVETYLSKAEATAKRAIQLDPNLPGSYVTLGFVMFLHGNLLMSEDMMQKAFALDPNDPDTLNLISLLLAARGQVKEAVSIRQQLRSLEPFVPTYNRFTAVHLWVDGQNDAAIAILQAQPPDEFNRSNLLAMIYASMGRYAEAADMLANVPPGQISAAVSKEAARLLRTAPVSRPAPQSLPQLGGGAWVYLYVGAPERALEPFESRVAIGLPDPIPAPWVWHASYAPVRKTERFKAYVRNAGFVDYWRAKGWPQWCHPVGTDDFACE